MDTKICGQGTSINATNSISTSSARFDFLTRSLNFPAHSIVGQICRKSIEAQTSRVISLCSVVVSTASASICPSHAFHGLLALYCSIVGYNVTSANVIMQLGECVLEIETKHRLLSSVSLINISSTQTILPGLLQIIQVFTNIALSILNTETIEHSKAHSVKPSPRVLRNVSL